MQLELIAASWIFIDMYTSYELSYSNYFARFNSEADLVTPQDAQVVSLYDPLAFGLIHLRITRILLSW